MNLIFHCPICKARLAGWVVRHDLTCHHCRWALRSNFGMAMARSLLAGTMATFLLLAALRWALGAWLPALDVWMHAAAGVGVLVAGICLRWSVRLTPWRPPGTPRR